MYNILFILVVSRCLFGNDGLESGFKIFRSERDVFTNLKCTDDSQQCTAEQCKNYNAECADQKCKFCRCKTGENTFKRTTYLSSNGKCISDEEIEPKSVPKEKFLLKSDEHPNKCLEERSGSKYITGKNCAIVSSDKSDSWLWTNKQLMNVKTLKCMKQPETEKDKIIMTQCQATSMFCDYKKKKDAMEIGWKNGKSKRYLHLSKENHAVSLSSGKKHRPRWRGVNKQDICNPTVYLGCYRFSDGSFMEYLDFSKSKISIAAPIFNQNGQCRIEDKFESSRDGQKWNDHHKSLFSIDSTTKSTITIKIKIESIEVLKARNGSLLKLFVVCEGKKRKVKEEHCVLLKLKSLPTYKETINSNPSPTSEATSTTELTTLNVQTTQVEKSSPSHSTITDDITTKTIISLQPTGKLITASNGNSKSTKHDKHEATSTQPSSQPPNFKASTTDNPQEDLREKSESSGTNSVLIAVTVTLLLLALLLILGILVYYKRRKRVQQPENSHEANGAVNYSKGMYEDPDRLYEALKEEEHEAHDQQPGETSDSYSYPDTNFIANPNPTSSQLEYTYAKDTDIPRINKDNTNATLEAPTSTPVYHTLENEAAPSSDFYTYPEPSNIFPQAPTEFEYTYAKDTEIPRIAKQTKPSPGSNPTPSYTVVQEEPGLTEQEYSYAKNTDVPRIPTSTGQTTQGNFSSATNSGLYHTLEEPSPPKAPVYSTLEEPKDIENQPATDEMPNSSDQMYIDVIEDPITDS